MVALEGRLGAIRNTRIDVGEEILSIERIVAEEVVDSAMEFVGAALGDGVDLRGTATVLGGVGVGLNLEFLDFVDGGNGGDGVEVG